MALSEAVEVEEARRLIASGEARAVDVRTDAEWQDGRVPGAIRVDTGNFDAEVEGLPDDVQLVVIGSDERSAGEIAGRLRERGREAGCLTGGLEAWRDADFPTQPSQDPDDDVTV